MFWYVSANHAITSVDDQVVRIDSQTYLAASWFVIAAWPEEKVWCGTEYGFGTFDVGLFGSLDWAACYPRVGAGSPGRLP